MNKRREEEKRKAKEEAEAEIAELKAAGKVGPKKFVTKSISQRTKKESNSAKIRSPRQQALSPRNATGTEQVSRSGRGTPRDERVHGATLQVHLVVFSMNVNAVVLFIIKNVQFLCWCCIILYKDTVTAANYYTV